MRKFLLLSITLAVSFQLSAQDKNEKEAIKYFRQGNEAFYDRSDFTGAINSYNQALYFYLKPEYYLKRGQVYLAKSDTCAACRDFYIASAFNNGEADKRWKQMCVRILSIKSLSESQRRGISAPKRTDVMYEPCTYDTIITVNSPSPDEPIWPKAEISPKFPGGDIVLQQLVDQNLKPKLNGLGKDDVPSGKVSVSFIIEKDGSLSEIIVDGVNPSYHNAFIEFAKSLPKYRPAKNKGVPIRFKNKLEIPIR